MRQWRHKSVNQKKIQNQWKGSTNISTNSLSEAPHIIFEKFLASAELKEICNQSNEYAKSKGKHTFNLILQKLNSFITILLLSGYTELSRQKNVLGKKKKKIVTMSWHQLS